MSTSTTQQQRNSTRGSGRISGRGSGKRRASTARLLTAALGASLCASLGAIVLVASPASAASFAVTNTNDSGAGSLRAAIAATNASAGADTITFDVGVTGTISLTTGELEITEGVTIAGPGSGSLTINAGGLSRIFDIHADSPGASAVVVSGLTLTNAKAPVDPAAVNPGDLQDGGAVVASSAGAGSLALNGVVVSGSTGGDGGGVMTRGLALTVSDSTISGNTSQFNGGGLRTFNGAIQVVSSTVTGNSAVTSGGGIRISGGSLSVQQSTVSNNQAGSAGGIRAASEAAVTVANSTISGNSATGVGVTGNGGGLVLDNQSTVSSAITGSLISGNTASANGGGADLGTGSISLSNVTVTGNTAGNEGGGLRFNGGTTTVTSGTVVGNSAVHGGGVLSTGPGATLRNTILAANSATDPTERDVTVRSLPGDGPVNLDYSLVESAPVAGVTANVTTGSIIFGQDPMLGALAANGGPTQTMRPAAASPVVDKGKSFGIIVDQRGRERPVDLASVANRNGGDGSDIGAVELSSSTDAKVIGNLTAPTVPASASTNVPLTATDGTWSPGGVTLAYHWYAGATLIPGATAKTYTPTAGDVGKTLSVRVTASKATWTSTTVASNSTGPVVLVLGTVHNVAVPTISGTARVGMTLTATSQGTWTPQPGVVLARHWLRSGAVIPGATGASYVIGAADVGKRISLRVDGTKPGYAPATATSAQSGTVARGTLVTSGAARIAGTLKVAKTLTAVAPSCRPVATVRYQWLRSGKVIGGASRATYKLRKADKGKKVSVRITVSKAGYATKTFLGSRAGKVR